MQRKVARSFAEGIGNGLANVASAGHAQVLRVEAAAPSRRFYERELAEHVRAGSPSMAGEGELEDLNIDAYLVRDQHNTTLVRVKGDSMVDAGIREGDVVVVERRTNATVGQIVVANIAGEFTLKRLVRERGQVRLRAENPKYAALRLRDDFQIFGVVVGLIRSYR